jgi:hypothetical protein
MVSLPNEVARPVTLAGRAAWLSNHSPQAGHLVPSASNGRHEAVSISLRPHHTDLCLYRSH